MVGQSKKFWMHAGDWTFAATKRFRKTRFLRQASLRKSCQTLAWL